MKPSLFARTLLDRANRASVSVSDVELEQHQRYYELLEQWNSKINLTALPLEDCPARTLDRLFIEPLIAAGFLAHSPISVLDVGSGSGSPALPLKIVRPHLRLTMLESRERKASFLRQAVRALGLTATTVLTGRFETLDPGVVSEFDVITVRAVRLDRNVVARMKDLAPAGRIFSFGTPLPADHWQLIESRDLPGGSALKIYTASSLSIRVTE